MEVLSYAESFAVRRESYRFGRTQVRVVLFRRTAEAIELEQQEQASEAKVTDTFIPILEPNGRWYFVASGDRRLEEWQVRRDALEQLFFDSRVTWAPNDERWSVK